MKLRMNSEPMWERLSVYFLNLSSAVKIWLPYEVGKHWHHSEEDCEFLSEVVLDSFIYIYMYTPEEILL